MVVDFPTFGNFRNQGFSLFINKKIPLTINVRGI
uniref:Uncharacterized protein n=1 Tax=Firmicutes phage HS19 TaxID=3056397 RepID=A0AA49X534_9VIRU|nr:MAG: hypothetical protein [Firmicutes phage HS19]